MSEKRKQKKDRRNKLAVVRSTPAKQETASIGALSKRALQQRRATGQPYIMSLMKGIICPDRMRTTLLFQDVSHGFINSVGNRNASYRYRPTGLFDVDPTLGGTAVAGFVEWAAFYVNYRVLGYTVEVEFSNREAFDLVVYTIPGNLDPGATPTLANAEAYQMNYACMSRQLSAKGGQDRFKMIQTVDTAKFVGSLTQRYDDNYSSAVTTIPVNNVFQQVGVLSISSVLVAGVGLNLRIAIEVEFYERASLSS